MINNENGVNNTRLTSLSTFRENALKFIAAEFLEEQARFEQRTGHYKDGIIVRLF
jgi:hypothetical protein